MRSRLDLTVSVVCDSACHGNALRAQARYGTRTVPPATRDRVRAISERLIHALNAANERYLLGEGVGREVALRDLARLVAGALRQSCAPVPNGTAC
ncbi:hypothetical protein [Streptomyces sp. NBRC 14336]|uniref:hypothetical protein n=1 Tax=Streptomyces sp. NBRC 14336 TaxID=3030992 RepID=UPI0025538091|nr:hypothetical protein [Streptomyces sp. NBRC 14336]